MNEDPTTNRVDDEEIWQDFSRGQDDITSLSHCLWKNFLQVLSEHSNVMSGTRR